MIDNRRFSVFVHHFAVAKPTPELLRLGLLHKFPVDRRAGVIYTVYVVVLHSNPGELNPGLTEQATSHYVKNADLVGVFLLYGFCQQFVTVFP